MIAVTKMRFPSFGLSSATTSGADSPFEPALAAKSAGISRTDWLLGQALGNDDGGLRGEALTRPATRHYPPH
jgi:hypothetical protein